jgi:hypothetical protein
MFEIQYVTNLQWDNPEHTFFSCVVKYSGFAEALPAGVNGLDPTPHIRELWTNANAGVYGAIAEYVYTAPPPNTAEQNKLVAELHLAKTDWVNEPDVYDPATTPHLLNRDAFLAFRAQLREIVLNPVAGNLNWPTKPTEEWSS